MCVDGQGMKVAKEGINMIFWNSSLFIKNIMAPKPILNSRHRPKN